jgi:hypothetical protein
MTVFTVFITIYLTIMIAAFIIRRFFSRQASGQQHHDSGADYMPILHDTSVTQHHDQQHSHGHDSGGWADLHGGGGAWDSHDTSSHDISHHG